MRKGKEKFKSKEIENTKIEQKYILHRNTYIVMMEKIKESKKGKIKEVKVKVKVETIKEVKVKVKEEAKAKVKGKAEVEVK